MELSNYHTMHKKFMKMLKGTFESRKQLFPEPEMSKTQIFEKLPEKKLGSDK